MKFTQYERTIAPTAMNNVAVKAPSNINAYGANGSSYNDMAGALGQVNKVVMQQQADEDAVAVVGARNDIMTKVTDGLYGENGLLTTGVGVNAKGLTDRVTKLLKDTSDDIISKQDPNVAFHLRKNISENMFNLQRIAAAQERNQKVAVDKSNFESSISNNNQLAALNFDKPEFIASQINQNNKLIDARALTEGWTPASIQATKNKNINGMINDAVLAAVSQNNYDVADNLLSQYRKNMDQETYARLYTSISKKKEVKDNDLLARNIFSQCYDGNNGHFDLEKAQQLVNEKYGPTAVTTMQGNQNIDKGLNTGWRAWGNKRMDNGRVGCAEAVGKIGSYYSPFLAEESKNGVVYVPTIIKDAEQNGIKVLNFDESKLQKGDCIVYGDEDHIVIADGNGGYYGNSSNANDGDSLTVHSDNYNIDGLTPTQIIKTGSNGESQQVSAYDPERYKKIMTQVQALAHDEQTAYKQKKKDYLDSIGESVKGAGSYADAISLIDSSTDLTLSEINTLKSAAATFYGVTKSRTGTGQKGKVYDPAKDRKVLKIFNLKRENGDTITTTQQFNANEAAKQLIDNGYEEGGADLDNQAVMSKITDVLENGGTKDAVADLLLGNGASQTQIDYYLSIIDDGY